MSVAAELAGQLFYIYHKPAEIMDADRCMEACNIINKHLDKPRLGLATTRQLIDEITARLEIDGTIDYRTVGENNHT